MARRIKGSGQLELDLFDAGESKRLREENGRLRAVSQRLQTQNAELIDEINRLQRLVYSSVGIVVPEEAFESNAGVDLRSVTKRSNIEDKIALFRSYFKGRADVYAVRAANTNGKISHV